MSATAHAWVLSVAVQTPAHAGLGDLLSYSHGVDLPAGTLVRVPLGRREVLGVVWRSEPAAPGSALLDGSLSDADGVLLKPVAAALDALPPLNDDWRHLVAFAARYYQRGLGEVALAALPPQLRELDSTQLARRLKRREKKAAAPADPGAAAALSAPAAPTAAASSFAASSCVAEEANATAGAPLSPVSAAATPPALSPEQSAVLAALAAEAATDTPRPALLFGSTGSGKTEVYLQAVARCLAADPTAQALVMVPEINLTPQLEARFRARFAPWGVGAVVALHSGMTNPQRLHSWLAALTGQARIVLGTRMAVFAPLPGLRLIVVDEEHDPSYKQQEGARYSARDLAVWRGHRTGAQVLLGSATPSLESWHHSRSAEGDAPAGRYLRLHMPSRIGAGALPRVRRVDMQQQPPKTLISAGLLDAMTQRVARGEQSMVFLNRRGYAPVLACTACDWKSECPHCSAYRVFHKIDRTLRCHHCGFTERVPRACPSCGNPDIAPVGRGTERLEEQLAALFADVRRPDGEPVRIARIDADSTRHEGALESQLAQVHSGEVDVLVGTQMIAKGHDFRRITLVAAVNPDGALFSSDFRAPERLFSLLMQSAGRAGRDADWLAAQGSQAEMWIQTFHPQHPLFDALVRHDYPRFAAQQLQDREAAAMPPFAFQALVRADARTQEGAQAFLNAAGEAADALPESEGVMRYPAVPLAIQRVANVERAQMLLESPSRQVLQRLLAAWQPVLQEVRRSPAGQGLVRWLVDVDPQSI